MSEYDDEDNGYDGSEDTDLSVHALRAEIVRLEAQLDQLTACVRERAREAAEIRAKLVMLEEGLERLKARRRRDEKILIAVWMMLVLSLGLWLSAYFRA
jgi:hypothetical protein